MKDPKLLETVSLAKDLPEHGLRAGEIGTIVEVYDETAVEVEFVEDSGYTKALLTLPTIDLRRWRSGQTTAGKAITASD